MSCSQQTIQRFLDQAAWWNGPVNVEIIKNLNSLNPLCVKATNVHLEIDVI